MEDVKFDLSVKFSEKGVRFVLRSVQFDVRMVYLADYIASCMMAAGY